MAERISTMTTESARRSPVCTVEVSGMSEDLLQRLDALARKRGTDRNQVIREIITRELDAEEAETTAHSFDAALAPIRAGFDESGMTEEEAQTLLDEGLRSVRAERRAKNVGTGETKNPGYDG